MIWCQEEIFLHIEIGVDFCFGYVLGRRAAVFCMPSYVTWSIIYFLGSSERILPNTLSAIAEVPGIAGAFSLLSSLHGILYALRIFSDYISGTKYPQLSHEMFVAGLILFLHCRTGLSNF